MNNDISSYHDETLMRLEIPHCIDDISFEGEYNSLIKIENK